MTNKRVFLISSVRRMLHSASLRDLRIIYEFVLHLTTGKGGGQA